SSRPRRPRPKARPNKAAPDSRCSPSRAGIRWPSATTSAPSTPWSRASARSAMSTRKGRTDGVAAQDWEKSARSPVFQGIKEDPPMTRTLKMLSTLALTASLLPAAALAHSVKVNGVALQEQQLQALERAYQIGIADGAYWYDRATGAWGLQSGPQMGL